MSLFRWRANQALCYRPGTQPPKVCFYRRAARRAANDCRATNRIDYRQQPGQIRLRRPPQPQRKGAFKVALRPQAPERRCAMGAWDLHGLLQELTLELRTWPQQLARHFLPLLSQPVPALLLESVGRWSLDLTCSHPRRVCFARSCHLFHLTPSPQKLKPPHRIRDSLFVRTCSMFLPSPCEPIVPGTAALSFRARRLGRSCLRTVLSGEPSRTMKPGI